MRKGATSPKLVDGQTYRNQSFKRVDWSDQQFDDVKFYNCTFEDVLCARVMFNYCSFVDCKFDAVSFEDVKVHGGVMFDSTFSNSSLEGVEIDQAANTNPGERMLKDCAFLDTDLTSVNFRCNSAGLFFDDVSVKTVGGNTGKGFGYLSEQTLVKRHLDFRFDPPEYASSAPPAAASKKPTEPKKPAAPAEVSDVSAWWWPLTSGPPARALRSRVESDPALKRKFPSPTLLYSYIILIQNGVSPDPTVEKLLFVDGPEDDRVECRRVLFQLKTVLHTLLPAAFRLYKTEAGDALAAELESLDVTDQDTVDDIHKLMELPGDLSLWDRFNLEVESSKWTELQQNYADSLYNALESVCVTYARLWSEWNRLLGGKLSGRAMAGQLTLDSAMLNVEVVMCRFDKSIMPAYTAWLRAAQNPPTLRELSSHSAAPPRLPPPKATPPKSAPKPRSAVPATSAEPTRNRFKNIEFAEPASPASPASESAHRAKRFKNLELDQTGLTGAAPKKSVPQKSVPTEFGISARSAAVLAAAVNLTRFQVALAAAVKKISDNTIYVSADSVRSPEDFKKEDPNISADVVAVVVYDGDDDLAGFFEYDHERYDEIAMMESAMEKAGFMVEPITRWYAYVHDMAPPKPARRNPRKRRN